MNTLEQLVREARKRRDDSIALARDHYKLSIKSIKHAARESRAAAPRNRRKRRKTTPNHGGDYSKMTTREAAELVLLERGPLSIIELTLDVMSRGCRAGDCPRAVGHAIRNALRYHEGRFFRDSEGRWVVINNY